MMLDSGAQVSLVGTNVLKPEIKIDATKKVKISSIHGTEETMGEVEANILCENLKIPVNFQVMKNSPVSEDGIIGFDVLQPYAIIDGPREKLTWTSEQRKVEVPIHIRQGMLGPPVFSQEFQNRTLNRDTPEIDKLKDTTKNDNKVKNLSMKNIRWTYGNTCGKTQRTDIKPTQKSVIPLKTDLTFKPKMETKSNIEKGIGNEDLPDLVLVKDMVMNCQDSDSGNVENIFDLLFREKCEVNLNPEPVELFREEINGNVYDNGLFKCKEKISFSGFLGKGNRSDFRRTNILKVTNSSRRKKYKNKKVIGLRFHIFPKKKRKKQKFRKYWPRGSISSYFQDKGWEEISNDQECEFSSFLEYERPVQRINDCRELRIPEETLYNASIIIPARSLKDVFYPVKETGEVLMNSFECVPGVFVAGGLSPVIDGNAVVRIANTNLYNVKINNLKIDYEKFNAALYPEFEISSMSGEE